MSPLLGAAIPAAVALIGFGLCASAITLVFLRRCRRSGEPAGGELARAEVLVALRGAAPHVEACLTALLHQDHPAYAVHIVVDSEADPAWEVAQRVARDAGAVPVRVAPLRARRETCSLKCSALVQMIADLRPDTRLVAILDADVLPHRNWLRQLTAPLADPGVGATFGIPWCVPATARWGSLLRSRWWMLAGVAMALRGWPWGGSTALAVTTLRAADLQGLWARSLSSDTPVPEALASIGLRARWVPALVLLDREDSSVREFFQQLVRYALVRRLYLPGRMRGRVLGAALGGVLAVNVGVVAGSLLGEERLPGLMSAGALALYVLMSGALLDALDRKARQVLRGNGVRVPRPTRAAAALRWLTLPLLFPLIVAGAAVAHRTRAITWRGARYTVGGAWDIRLARDAVRGPS